ncbi:MAG: hypothetical protein CV088_16480 [Nitrospira sp. LK70]|nr:hypothetical protein [Nitrospira sp. LK70]
MPCPYWICGLESPALVLGRIRKRSPDKVFLTTGEPHASKGLVLKIAKTLEIEKEDYGLAVVSCASTIKEKDQKDLMNDGNLPKEDKDIDKLVDLSKLEVIAFFSFLDPNNPSVRMSAEIALWQFNTLFKNFLNKDELGRKREIWDEWAEYHQSQGSSKSPKRRTGYSRTNTSAPTAAGPS